MNRKIYLALLSMALVLFLLTAVFYYGGLGSYCGPALISAFILLAFAVRGFQAFRGLAYTVWIFTAVTASMFYPGYFLSIGDFQLKKLIVPLLQIIMFGMGSQMSFNDFKGVILMPKGVIIGVTAQFTIMPFIGFAIAGIFNFPPEIAAGIILIGCVPSGLASNVMSYIGRANLALAVTIGAVSTLMSPFVTPFLMKWLGGQFIQVNFWSMMLDILNMIILPVVAGFIFNLFMHGKESTRNKIWQLTAYFAILFLTNLVYVKSKQAGSGEFFLAFSKSLFWFMILPALGALALRRSLKNHPERMGRILSFISMLGIAVIITVITAAGRDSLLEVGSLLILTSLIHNLAGYLLGYSIAWVTGMPEKDRRTLAFEVGMQNGGLASGLALQMGKVATVGLAPAIFGPLMNITGSALANWWRSRIPEDEKENKHLTKTL